MNQFLPRTTGGGRRRSAALSRVAALLALLAAVTPAVAETPMPVKRMLDNAPMAAESRCSYTRVRIKEDVTRYERYQAGRTDGAWELVRVNDRPPTERELREYARDDEPDRRHPLAFDLRTMVDPAHWRLRSETADRAVYEFRLRPNEDLDASLVDKVIGTLVMDRNLGQPVSIVIENTQPAYVAPLVRIAEYRQEMDFQWNAEIGAAVLTRAETRYRGRALGLKVVRKHKLVRYTDYQCAPAEQA